MDHSMRPRSLLFRDLRRSPEIPDLGSDPALPVRLRSSPRGNANSNAACDFRGRVSRDSFLPASLTLLYSNHRGNFTSVIDRLI